MRFKKFTWLAVALAALWLSACQSQNAAQTPTIKPELVLTAAAQTAIAMLTQAATPTPTLQVTSTSGPIPTGSSADRVVFVADVTIPDNTVLAPGTAFKKTWKVQNAGTTTWTTGYALAFISGEQMSSTNSVALTQTVAPGAQIDISVDMVAPTNNGTYQGYWKMKNAAGQFFNESIYVLIKVGAGGSTQPASSSTSSAQQCTPGIAS